MRLPIYHVVVLAIYAIATPILVTLIQGNLYFGISSSMGISILIAVASFAIFASFFIKRSFTLTFTSIFWGILYAIAFAFPEEIIFRGLVQGFLAIHIQNTILVVLLSSLIFGLAHLYNSGKWNIKFTALAFLAGLPLGTIFALTGSLLIPIILHGAFVLVLKLAE